MLAQLTRRIFADGGPDLITVVPSSSRKSRQTILVAENEKPVREFTCLVLRGMGYHVLEANSGPEALQTVRRSADRPVDLLFTDLLMPAMSGKELADRLWSILPMHRVLFCSPYPEWMARRLWQLEPKIEVIQRPFSSHLLAQKVEEILALNQAVAGTGMS